MLRFVGALALLAAAVPLAGCNETTNGTMAGPAVGTPIAPSAYRLPPGSPCSKEINQFHAIVKSDLATGNVEQKVYDSIDKDLSRAADACAAGQGGQAHAIVVGAKTRHGYRA